MKLIIDIPEEKYKTIQDGMYCGMLDADLYRDIKNGIPLDDLRAEIAEQKNYRCFDDDDMCIYKAGLIDALEIIDKYRGDADEMS